MTDFTYAAIAWYTPSGTYIDRSESPGTLSDADADDQFEGSDIAGPIPPHIGFVNPTYVGTLDLGGQIYPVFEDGNLFVFIPETGLPTIDYPFGLDINLNWISTGTVYQFCFAAGSLIATREGETAVEDLRMGDPILTEDGRSVRVKWIGRQTVSPLFGLANRLMPVRFAAGSLGDGLPTADLTVTADHGMLVDGVICHAGALVNGTTITRVPLAEMGETYTVYHIETEAHEIILANGAPAETFIDNVSRRVFDNYAEFEELYGDVPEMEELPYPRAMSARQVPGVIRVKLGLVKAA
ncbi:Hint domain-containing protein [Nioella aestuarii]|uniref:Hint domain-containing protein n=1 Tax=Nioella aestuarii TaxID=1662864 RepID=UPI003D7FF6F3